MKRKQRILLPRRRFGYVILIIIKFGDLLLGISLRIINALRNYIKQLVNKTQLRLVFSTHFSVFGYLMKHFFFLGYDGKLLKSEISPVTFLDKRFLTPPP